MDPLTVLLGLFAIGFGVFTTVVRALQPEMLGKLEPMREKFGNTAGTTIHVAAYSVAPILFGVIVLIAALRGATLF